MTVAEFKQLIESETKFPVAVQHLFYDGQALRDDSATLEALKLKDGEMLAMMVNQPSRQERQSGRSRNQQQQQQQVSENDSARIEQIRQQVLASPEQMGRLLQSTPELAEVINDPQQFRRVWQVLIDERNRRQQDREREIMMLNEDPFNSDNQKKIEEIIRREKIEENLQYAYENNPAGTVA
jgi:DNA damage-inducible protein 1